MATVTITYVAPVAPAARTGENIFPEYLLSGGYANNAKIIEENIYDNAPSGLGLDFDLSNYINSNTMHPGVLLAFKKAMTNIVLTAITGDTAPAFTDNVYDEDKNHIDVEPADWATSYTSYFYGAHQYSFETTDDIEAAYYEEVGTALADNGFTVTVAA